MVGHDHRRALDGTTARRPIALGAVVAALLTAACTGPVHGIARPSAGALSSGAPGPGGAPDPSGATGPGRTATGLPSHPNIVFVLTDDLSTDLLPYMPHVQALERRGTSLRNYFVVDSLCCPSRTAIFTGQYPHDDGVFTNAGSDGGYGAFDAHRDAERTFGLALQRVGYDTGFMGKYLNGYQPNDPVPPGWDEWDAAGNGYPELNYQLNENGTEHTYGSAPRDYLTDVLSAKASGFISRAAAGHRPFALEVATFAPHRPFTPAPVDAHRFPRVTAPRGPAWDTLPTDPPAWLAHHRKITPHAAALFNWTFRQRVRSVQAVDRMIGHLEQQLVRAGVADNTYFVFSSDNGFHIGQYRLGPGKQTAFDTDIRVPLIVAGPGVPANAVVTTPAASIDLAPTFEQLGSAPAPDRPDGASMLDLWLARPVPATWPQAVLIEHHGPDTLPDDPDRQTLAEGDPPSYEAMRSRTSLYVEYRYGQREYYDLVDDPDELHNLAAHLPGTRLATLHTELLALENCHGAVQCQAAGRASP